MTWSSGRRAEYWTAKWRSHSRTMLFRFSKGFGRTLWRAVRKRARLESDQFINKWVADAGKSVDGAEGKDDDKAKRARIKRSQRCFALLSPLPKRGL